MELEETARDFFSFLTFVVDGECRVAGDRRSAWRRRRVGGN
eukprot:SAG11_NODE_41670_length_191_cov_12.891304_1_plen_40_part_10